MNRIKYNSINMRMKKVLYYSLYVDCLARVINEFIESGDYNIEPTDVPTLMVLLTKFSNLMRSNIIKMASDIEFYYKFKTI